jgi:hypothetical protein
MTLTEQGGVTSSVSICDTLCFVANVLVLISNMCFTLERKNLKKIVFFIQIRSASLSVSVPINH